MVKATVNFDDELYRRLIKETVEKYGKMRGFSKLINEKLWKAEGVKPSIIKPKKEEIKKRLEIVEKTFGAWGPGPSGAEYVRKLRRGSEKRLKRLGL